MSDSGRKGSDAGCCKGEAQSAAFLLVLKGFWPVKISTTIAC